MIQTIKTRDKKILEHLEPLVDKYITENEVSEYQVEQFMDFLKEIINDKNVGIFLSYDERKIYGYAIVVIMRTITFPFASTLQLSFDEEEVGQSLLTEIKTWLTSLEVNIMSIMSKRPKKYKNLGFKVKHHVMELLL